MHFIRLLTNTDLALQTQRKVSTWLWKKNSDDFAVLERELTKPELSIWIKSVHKACKRLLSLS